MKEMAESSIDGRKPGTKTRERASTSTTQDITSDYGSQSTNLLVSQGKDCPTGKKVRDMIGTVKEDKRFTKSEQENFEKTGIRYVTPLRVRDCVIIVGSLEQGEANSTPAHRHIYIYREQSHKGRQALNARPQYFVNALKDLGIFSLLLNGYLAKRTNKMSSYIDYIYKNNQPGTDGQRIPEAVREVLNMDVGDLCEVPRLEALRDAIQKETGKKPSFREFQRKAVQTGYTLENGEFIPPVGHTFRDTVIRSVYNHWPSYTTPAMDSWIKKKAVKRKHGDAEMWLQWFLTIVTQCIVSATYDGAELTMSEWIINMICGTMESYFGDIELAHHECHMGAAESGKSTLTKQLLGSGKHTHQIATENHTGVGMLDMNFGSVRVLIDDALPSFWQKTQLAQSMLESYHNDISAKIHSSTTLLKALYWVITTNDLAIAAKWIMNGMNEEAIKRRFIFYKYDNKFRSNESCKIYFDDETKQEGLLAAIDWIHSCGDEFYDQLNGKTFKDMYNMLMDIKKENDVKCSDFKKEWIDPKRIKCSTANGDDDYTKDCIDAMGEYPMCGDNIVEGEIVRDRV